MAGGLKGFVREQPILAGCIGVLALVGVAVCGGGALLFVLGAGAFQKVKDAAGVDSFVGLAMDCQRAGYALNVEAATGQDVVFKLAPMEPRQVSCDELRALILPHLTGSLETVRVESESWTQNPDGSSTRSAVSCEWSGHPSKDGPAAPAAAEPPATTD